MIERSTGRVYDILAYGKINRKKARGSVEFLTRFIYVLEMDDHQDTHKTL